MSVDTIAFHLDAVGQWGSPQVFTVQPDHVRQYAGVTGDQWSSASLGEIAGPVFAAVAGWDAMDEASRRAVPGAALDHALHFTQDFHISRPLHAGMTVVSRGAPLGVLRRRSGTEVVYCIETRDADEELLVEAWFCEYYRGIWPSEERGIAAPALNREPEDVPARSLELEVPPDITTRYADVSFDHFSIHLDDEAARRVGLPGRIVHGLCTLALTANALLRSEAKDVDAVGRLAVRFSRPLLPGAALTVSTWNIGENEISFTAESGPDTVLRNGFLAFR